MLPKPRSWNKITFVGITLPSQSLKCSHNRVLFTFFSGLYTFTFFTLPMQDPKGTAPFTDPTLKVPGVVLLAFTFPLPPFNSSARWQCAPAKEVKVSWLFLNHKMYRPNEEKVLSLLSNKMFQDRKISLTLLFYFQICSGMHISLATCKLHPPYGGVQSPSQLYAAAYTFVYPRVLFH